MRLAATRGDEIANLFATPSVTPERRGDGSIVVRSNVRMRWRSCA
jgi:hypothetical protein